MDANILIVDDEQEIADLVELYLKNEGFCVYKFYTAKEALKCIEEETLDLAILDIMLPDVDGLTICRKIREKYTFPVIMLTAKNQEIDMISGLALGADDYVTKPFLPLELVARVKAQLRRYIKYNHSQAAQEEESLITVSGLVIDKDNHLCLLNEKSLNLTPIEFSLLWYLCKNKGRVVRSDELFYNVWGEKYYTNNNTVMVHIRHIREKMKDNAEHPKYIKTVWGVGYKVEN
jgi:two-component system response regulator VanR